MNKLSEESQSSFDYLFEQRCGVDVDRNNGIVSLHVPKDDQSLQLGLMYGLVIEANQQHDPYSRMDRDDMLYIFSGMPEYCTAEFRPAHRNLAVSLRIFTRLGLGLKYEEDINHNTHSTIVVDNRNLFSDKATALYKQGSTDPTYKRIPSDIFMAMLENTDIPGEVQAFRQLIEESNGSED